MCAFKHCLILRMPLAVPTKQRPVERTPCGRPGSQPRPPPVRTASSSRAIARTFGLVWCKLSTDEPMVANVFQMWVDPASRGMGAGRALLNEAVDWAERVGARRICLGVTAAETPAMRLYLACGFRLAGEIEPLRESSSLMVQPMSLTVGFAPPEA